MPKIFTASEIIGKTLIAKKNVNVRSNPSTVSTIKYTIKKGQPTLPVFSYVYQDGELWWQFEDNTFTMHKPEFWSTDAIREQGAKTVSERAKEKQDSEKGILDKLTDSLSTVSDSFGGGMGIVNKILLFGGVAIVVYLIVDRVILNPKNT
jgi:hypothetical protein